MTGHVKVVGILWIVWGAMGLIIGLFVASLLIGAGLIAKIEGGEPEALSILTIIATFITGLFLILSLPDIIVGIGILKHQQWGRILGFILAALNLLSIPFGTALGIYTLYVLLSPEGQAIFEGKKVTET
ncbi:MAG: hypothetical protein JSV84_12565 [Gemmatimonadota bacterium]|nr:MAG: hypothetical protein JSV84_12565 [Gemmatimonadota bacterium]